MLGETYSGFTVRRFARGGDDVLCGPGWRDCAELLSYSCADAMSSTPSIREIVEFGLERIQLERTTRVPVRELVRLFKIFGELNAFFHQPMHFPDVSAVASFLGSRADGGAYGLISEAYYGVLSGLLPPDVMQDIEAGELEHPVAPAYRATDISSGLGGEEMIPAQLGFSVADGETVDVSFADGNLVLRFKDWHEQVVEHRFIEALAFRWGARSTETTPRNDESYEVLNSAWLRDECQLEGYSSDQFVHHVLCFNAEKVLEVISRRATS